MIESELISLCKENDRKAQKALYDRFAPSMLGVCRRYTRNKEDAEDILVEGLYKVLANIHQYQGTGSFEGWIRRIMINEALMFLRKKHNFQISEEVDVSKLELSTHVSIEHELAARDILDLLDKLPTGYRTVFNLYVVEGYKHREIAELLGISINTSKSQLILAKERLQSLVLEMSRIRS